MKYKLTLKPSARSRTGVEYGTGPVMVYDVEGLPEGQKFQLGMFVLSLKNPSGRLVLTSRDVRPGGRAHLSRLRKRLLNCKSNSTRSMKRLGR